MTDDELLAQAQSRIGRVLRGKYRLDRVLGVGGMGSVYAATHRNKKRFAIKMLHPQLSISESIRARFLREGYVANTVDHPGAVAVLDDDIAEDGSAFLVMELLEGKTVDSIAEEHPDRRLPLALTMAIGDALLDVLIAAHAKGIVHRDLKPANIFLTYDGQLEVLDFGIARLRDDAGAAQATQSGAVLGTPAFMAPEQALADSQSIDARSDLFAVGATLFTLLSGAFVHETENAAVLMIRAATTQARSLARVLPTAPRSVVAVIDRALAFSKRERWESASAMRDALREASIAATGAPIASLPRRERVTGLERTVASDARMVAASGGGGFEATADPSPRVKARVTTAQGIALTEEPSPTRPWRSARRASMVVVALVVAVVGAGVIYARRNRSVSSAVRILDASPEPRPGRAPTTPQSNAAWEAGLQSERDGNWSASVRHFRAAVASDPSFAAAHLRLALRLHEQEEESARDEYRLAFEHRAALGEIDSALLSAWEPAFREPPDYAERARRAQEVAARYPRDPYVQVVLAWALNEVDGDFGAALGRALAIDPRYVAAYATWIDYAEYYGDWATVMRLTPRCLEAVSTAVACLEARADVHNVEGRCSEMRADARSLLAADSGSRKGYRYLAVSLLASGEPIEAAAEAMNRGDTTVADPSDAALEELGSRTFLALAQGDFDTARQAQAERATKLTSMRRDPLPALALETLILEETGDTAATRSVLKRARTALAASAGGENTIAEAALAHASAHIAVTTRAEEKTDLERLWARCDAGNGRTGLGQGTMEAWLLLYARTALDEADAAIALDVLSKRAIDVAPLRESAPYAGSLGRVYAMAGRFGDAAPLLERSVAVCGDVERLSAWLIDHTRQTYFLGISRETIGDSAGAVAAYRRVIERWGRAKPRSTTAIAARAALARLGVAP